MEDIRLYDFKKSEKFSLENVRNLALVCEEFCKTSNMQINYETKNDGFRMALNKCIQTNYGEFIESINRDSVVIEYSILPIVDNLTLFVDKSAVLAIVDLLLGGSGKVEEINREPTNIDLELLKYLFDNLLKRIYMPVTHEEIEVNKIYTNKVQYQKLNTKDMIFSSLINVSLQNEVVGYIRFCIPYESMKDIIDDLGSDKIKHEDNIEDDKCKDISCSEIYSYIQNVDIDVTAKLGCAKVSISDLLNLEVGDVILLEQKINEDITISIGEANIYKAKPGVIGIKKGIEIIDIIK